MDEKVNCKKEYRYLTEYSFKLFTCIGRKHMTPKTILIVEDNREISDMLSTFLSENGYETECAYNGLEAAACLKKREYTLILMDLMLPYRSGNDLIKELRTRSNVPVICLSARSGMETRLEVLRMGADDYILKPFDLNEVLVRIEVVLRRSCGNTGQLDSQDGEKKLMFKNLVLDMEGKCAVIKGTPLSLTAKELAILQLFLEYPNKTFSKANLYEAIWQEPYYYEDNTLNVHMSNLRNKLKKMDDGVEYIETVWGIGYRLAASNSKKET